MDRWVGKVAVVTGASAGIGAAIVVDLVKAGMTVVGLARRKDRVNELQSQIPSKATGKLHAYHCDISDDASVVEAFKWIESEFGVIHVLVNNAGIANGGAITDEGNEEKLKSVLQTNVWGLVLCTKKAVAIMKGAKVIGGHVININSVVGHKIPSTPANVRPRVNIYPSSKYAVTAISEVLRQEFNFDKLEFRSTNISPGAVRTDIWADQTILEHLKHLQSEDISQGVLYALGAPAHVNVSEIIIKPVGEIF